MSRSRAEVVQLRTVDPSTGEASEEAWFGVLASGKYGTSITRSAATLDELAEQVGDLSDERALWAFVQAQDPTIGTWDGQPIDPLDVFSDSPPGRPGTRT